MATRGVKQLTKLTINYCEHGGSSRSIREYISSSGIVDFATRNPTVSVIGNLRNGKHPNVNAEYKTGESKKIENFGFLMFNRNFITSICFDFHRIC